MHQFSSVRGSGSAVLLGIQVGDLAGLKKRLQDGGVAISETAKGQVQISDPEGNRVVVSESGVGELIRWIDSKSHLAGGGV